MCNLYIGYHWFLNDYPVLFILLCLVQLFAMIVLVGDGWTLMKQEIYLLRILRLLHSGQEFSLPRNASIFTRKAKMNLMNQANPPLAVIL